MRLNIAVIAAEIVATQDTLDRHNRMVLTPTEDGDFDLKVYPPVGRENVLFSCVLKPPGFERAAKAHATRWRVPRQNITVVES